MLELLLGFLIMFAALGGAGFARGRWLRQRDWVVVWFSASAALILVMVAALLVQGGFHELAYGLALGYVMGVTLHTGHHFIEEMREGFPRRRSVRGRSP